MSRGTGTNDRSNGLANGGPNEPPPSTLAAALISNLSTNKPLRRVEQDDLQRLMSEVSSMENSVDTLEGETKLEHQHKLIYVFARAVLERLTRDDPFLNVQQLVLQASEALDVFMSTIKATPEILDYVLQPGSTLQSRGQEPLWIWLFPRILTLLTRRHCDTLTEKIKDFFYLSFQAVSRSPKLWNLTSSFFAYFKDCASAILHHLESPSTVIHGSTIEIVLPSGNTEQYIFSQEKDGGLNDFLHCTYALQDAGDALWHATKLLSMLVDISMATAASYNATPVFQDYVAWMLDSFLSVHQLQRRWQVNSSLNQHGNRPILLSFYAVQALLSSLEDSLPGVMIRKGYTFISIVCADILEDPHELLERTTRIAFCSSLLNLIAICKKQESVLQEISVHLLPLLRTISEDTASFENQHRDIQQTSIIFCKALQNEEVALSHNFEDTELSSEFRRLKLDTIQEEVAENGRPSKRRKLSVEPDLVGEVTTNLYMLLGAQKATDLAGLHQIAEACFAELGNEDRCKAIEYLGQIPCAASSSLTVLRDPSGKIHKSRCSVCDESAAVPASDLSIIREALYILSKLVKAPAFLDSRRPRVLTMITLRRFLAHFKDPELVDLEISPLGQWCLQSLQSSLRELRIAAGRTLQALLSCNTSDEIYRRNRVNVIAILRSLWEKKNSKTYLQESCILAWGQIGRISKGQELNMVLLQLVEYLGNSNPIIAGVAYTEILKLSKAIDVPTERMFGEFWASIAIIAVRDLLVRPQTSQFMADLLEMTVPDFLKLTQAYTLPYLVQTKQADVIKRIAQARKDSEPWQPCMEPLNLTRILAFLLVQTVPEIESYILSLFKAISPRFDDLDLTDLLCTEPSSTAVQLLKAAGEADDSKKSRIRVALQMLASRVRLPSSDGHYNKKNSLGLFLEHHILGIVARFSDVVNDPREEYPFSEKLSSVRAIGEMVKIGKAYTRTARPQICACLQSAMAQKDLQASAFLAWQTMLTNLEESDVEMMLESTFSTIIQRWDSFDNVTQQRAQETLQYLLKERRSSVEVMISCLPPLSRFPLLADIDKRLEKLRGTIDTAQAFHAFARRVSHENSGVVLQALVELKAYLQLHQSFLQASAVSEQPHAVVGQLVRAILDSCVRFNGSHQDIAQLAAECIGLIGSLDSNRVECIREQREIVVVSNFSDPGETTDFVLFLLEEVMVKAFLSATDTGLQGFLSFVMQDLLEKCDFRDVCGSVLRGSIASEESDIYQKWLQLPLSVQQTLTPFLTSKYAVTEMAKVETKYPIFRPNNFRSDRIYNSWLKTFVLDLLQKPGNANTALIFPPLCRAIRIKDLSVASFLLPYVVLHVIIQGTDQQTQEIGGELLSILEYQSTSDSHIKMEELKMCSEAVFRILDYLSRWIQAKQAHAKRSRDVEAAAVEISRVTQLLEMIPAEVISRRSVECKSYARALFHWEQYIRDVRKSKTSSEQTTMLLERLQDIYTQIDEPDGIEGISAHLHVLDIDQQILGHRKAGRWTAAQSWYEIKLAEDPNDADVQVNLLTCLKESGQHDVLLNYVEGMHTATQTVSRVLPFATEASWATGRWQALERFVSMAPATGEDFNVSIGQALLALHKKNTDNFTSTIKTLREHIACSLSQSTTSSIASCHDTMLKFHVLTELEMIAGTGTTTPIERAQILASLDRRLEVVGAYLNDKQYLLGIRRAAMQLSSLNFTKGDVASAWLTSARLARKGNATHQSFNAVLHASQLGDESATIEHARLLWKEGQSRKAIQSLQGAIDSNAFISHNRDNSLTSFTGVDQAEQQNLLTARAHLLLAKWLDSAGQTQSNALRTQYQLAAKTHLTWEKGHYYLGRHYNKLLKTEKSLPPELQGEPFMIGEMAKLVIENYLRSLSFGTKYIYQTLPRILTLWLDLGAQVGQPVDAKYGNSKDFVARVTKGRQEQLAHIHSRFPKYITKIPAYMFYTALPQIISRINHSNPEVFKYLQLIILKVVAAFPQHALWGLLAVATSMQSDRKQRGGTIIQQLRANARKADPGSYDMKQMISMGEKLAHELVLVCNAGDFPGNKTAWAKITTDLGFRPKICMPSPLAVPFEKVLTATLPTLTDNIKTHKAFSQDVVTIQSFKDDVMVLSSLQKPRKLTARGSDGQSYGLMCKPKDDLRKDQRLMEFNSMINRALKRDAESSRRQLYIKTYAVTPLNEECGIIEWVDGLKTLRDILFALYRPLGISPNYREIEMFCEEACKSEDKLIFFSEKVLSNFPPIFHQWFVQQFPEPPAWFAARLRYTRSCAVMSMVGTILGLGDRHGENILFEEGNGGTFHVDFNCLFDKGLTFVKPERVPFRLTHNMVDAMGIYGYEGPFRKSSELTLKLLRQHEETLMTILEAFVYDPTLDLLTKKPEKKKKEGAIIIPTTAQGVLDMIQRKLRGLLAGESVPLGVEGQVDELIKQATNLHFLAGMYIGWCSFF